MIENNGLDTFIPAFLEGKHPEMSITHSHLQLKKPTFSIGRAKPTDVDHPIVDIQISKKHCEFQFNNKDNRWTVIDFSSNGVFVNGNRILKNSPVALESGDEIVFSEQVQKFCWTFNVGESKRKFSSQEGEQPFKKQRLQSDPQFNSQRLDNAVLEVKKVAAVRILREKLKLENAAKVAQQKVDALLAEKDVLVSRLEKHVKDQAVKDKEARETLLKEMEGKVDKEKIMKEFEENLKQERDKAEELRKKLMSDMEKRILLEEKTKKEEIQQRDQRLEELNKEKNELTLKLEKEKEVMDKELKDLQVRLNEENVSKELREKEFQEKLSEMTKKMEESMKKEKAEIDKSREQEKLEKEKLEREMENQKTLRLSEVKKLEDELENERATHAATLEIVRYEHEIKDEALKKKEKEIEDRHEQMMKRDQELKEKLAEVEKRKKEMEEQAERANSKAEEEALNKQALEQEIKVVADLEKAQSDMLQKLAESLEREYQCPTCLDVFICPVALNCGHTYCWLCLAQWKNSNGRTRGDLGTCPECREVVKHENRVIAIDHMIDAIMEQLGEEKKKEREEKIKERKADEEEFKSTATVAALATASRTGTSGQTRGHQRGRGTPVLRGTPASRGNSSVRGITPVARGSPSRRGQQHGGRGFHPNNRGHHSNNRGNNSNNNRGNHSNNRGNHSNNRGNQIRPGSFRINFVTNAAGTTSAINVEQPAPVASEAPIQVSSDSDTDTDIDDLDDPETPGTAYYGGYGHCYKCGRRGHWANGCPFS